MKGRIRLPGKQPKNRLSSYVKQFFGKKERAKPTAKQVVLQKEPVAKITTEGRFTIAERGKAEKMASEMLGLKNFTVACKLYGLRDPKQALVQFCQRVEGDQKIWKQEAKAEEAAERAGKEFNRGAFYAELFLRELVEEAARKSRFFQGQAMKMETTPEQVFWRYRKHLIAKLGIDKINQMRVSAVAKAKAEKGQFDEMAFYEHLIKSFLKKKK